MRSALLLLALLLVTAAPASAGPLVDTCGTADARLTGLCRGGEVFVSQGQAVCRNTTGRDALCTTPLGPKVSRKKVARHEKTWLHRALASQYELGSSLPFREAPWLGTHNSFNAASENVTPSQTDANQQLSLTDQLRIDMRSLELDVHWFPRAELAGARAPVLCHARSASEMHAGCTVERLFEDGLREIANWLDAHPDQVVLLYVEDHLELPEAFDATAVATVRALGERLYRPAGAGCLPLAQAPSRDDVRAAGAQVVIMSSCTAGTAWGGLVFDDSERAQHEGGAGDFTGCPGYIGHFQRFFEDSTGLSAGVGFTSGEPYGPGLTPEITGRMVRCGADLLGFDQILPDDGRLDAAVWSWAKGEPRRKRGACTVIDAGDGRWRAAPCDLEIPSYATPRTGFEAHTLVEAMKAAGVEQAYVAAT
jgi:hypothetical protein